MSNEDNILEAKTYVQEKNTKAKTIAHTIAGILVLSVAAGLVLYMFANKPKPERKAPEQKATLVEVMNVSKGDYKAVINAMGQIIPARQITLASRVSGEVISVDSNSYIPGGMFSEGQEILKIDPTDFSLELDRLSAELKQKKASLTSAQSDLSIEQGKQLVAKRELELLGEEISPEDAKLALREPQLKDAHAKVDSAQAACEVAKSQLDKAALDLSRTSIRAPFNCVIREKYTDLGSQVGINAQLADIACTDEFWAELSVPVASLRWLDIPENPQAVDNASKVTITNPKVWTQGQSRGGHIIRLQADLESTGRMAKILVSVPDPLAINSEGPAVILGQYIRAAIAGKTMSGVFRIAESSLHEGDKIWLMNDKSELEIRSVNILWSDNKYLYIAEGLNEGEKLLTSDIAAPVTGMKLRLNNKASSPKSKAAAIKSKGGANE